MLFDRICQSSVGKIVYYYSVKSKQVEKLLWWANKNYNQKIIQYKYISVI